ncbi:MAG: hypothetical protein ABW045_11740 [Gaiellaceae bacterium]|jgi:hypothetical protein
MATTGELTAGIVGGLVGGTLGVVSTLVGSYYGPRRLKEWRAEKAAAPKKECSRPSSTIPGFQRAAAWKRCRS